MPDLDKDFIHLAKLNFEGKAADSVLLVRKTLRDILKRRPELAKEAESVLQKIQDNGFRSARVMNDPIPVDMDSRMELVRREQIVNLEVEPIWSGELARSLNAIVAERERVVDLHQAGLFPTKTALLFGPPGVGKTLSARWLAMKLGRPLLTLDLAAVMSSFLGKTGNNIRAVLDFAKKNPSVLLLDEFDAIAKKRNDVSEVGELKRLVTVLLQAVDEWPSEGILLAATNHPELLDPAVWRRFDRVIEFPKPDMQEKEEYIMSVLGQPNKETAELVPFLAEIFTGLSYAEIEKALKTLLRESVIQATPIKACLENFIFARVEDFDTEQKTALAYALERRNYSQRRIREITGFSRDTLRERGIGIRQKN